MSLDHLSPSPSLPEILSLIQPGDIINSQLVSHRFDDVITSNSLSMSRIQASMVINYVESSNFDGCGFRVLVKTEERENIDRVCVYEDDTYILACAHNLCVRRQYRDNGYRIPAFPLTGPKTTRVLPSIGMKESLRLLFSHYFKQYHYRRIELRNFDRAHHVEMSGWCEIIGDEFRKCRTKCQSLYLGLHQTNSRYLLGQLDPSRIITQAKTNLQKVIDEIPRWNKPISIIVYPEAFNTFTPIVDLLKGWYCGKLVRMNEVSIYPTKGNDLPWTVREVVRMLNTGGIQCRRLVWKDGKKYTLLLDTTVEPFELGGDTFYIQRKLDSRFLEVKYNLFRRILNIKQSDLFL